MSPSSISGPSKQIFARFKAIAVNLAGHPSYGLLYVTAKLNLPRLCGLILTACIQRRPIGKPGQRDLFRMLVLNKAVFIEDVMAVASQIEHAELVLLGRTHLHFIAKGFFRKEVNDNNYHDLVTPEQITRYRDFLTSMSRVLNAKLKVKCALSGNFSYFEERELAFVLEAQGIPFVVVHKECLKTPGRIEEYEHLYRTNKGPFWGSRILVYNEMEKDLIVRTGVTQPDKVKVVGMPRLDWMHQSRLTSSRAAARKSVVLVSFHKDLNSLPPSDSEEEEDRDEAASKAGRPNLENVWDSVHTVMFELARLHPDVDVVIKTKGNSRDHAWLAELMERRGFGDSIANLRIVHGGELRDHILGATVICGLHSTGLLEALAANKTVIIPVFEESADAANQHHFIDFADSVIYAKSKQELVAHIERELQGPTLDRSFPETTRSLLDHWLGNSDGAASLRAADEIRKLTDSSTVSVGS